MAQLNKLSVSYDMFGRDLSVEASKWNDSSSHFVFLCFQGLESLNMAAHFCAAEACAVSFLTITPPLASTYQSFLGRVEIPRSSILSSWFRLIQYLMQTVGRPNFEFFLDTSLQFVEW